MKRALFALWATISALVLPITVLATPAQADPGTELVVEINDLDPRVLTDQDAVRISGTVQSPTKDLEDVDLHVYFRADSMVTVAQAQAYLDGPEYAGEYVATKTIDELPAGKQVNFQISVPADNLPLGSQWSWGPRGIEVLATNQVESGSDRTLLMWDSGYEVQATPLSVVSTISEGVVENDGAITAAPPTMQHRQIALKLAKIQGVTPAVGAGILNGQANFTKELAGLRKPVISLPASDADVAAIAHLESNTQMPKLVKDSKASPNLRASTDAGLKILPDYVLPSIDTLDRATISVWRDQKIVVPSGGLKPIDISTYDPSAWAQYNPHTGEVAAEGEPKVDVLFAQQDLTDLLAARADTVEEELDIQQMIRATTVIITRQLPNMPRATVALTPRNCDWEAIPARVEAALSNRWVKPISIDQVETASVEPVNWQTLPEYVDIPGAISDRETRMLEEAIESTAAMTSALQDSTGIVSNQRSRLLLAAALQLREHHDIRMSLVKDAIDEATELATSVRVEQSAPINMLDSSARLPVRVSSTLGEPVNAIVQLKPSDPRLQVDDEIEVQIPANGATQVEIPVRAVASGNVSIQVVVKGPNGLIIDDDTRLTVRVRAEWENKGMATAAVFLGILLVVGTVRTIKRGRRVDQTDEPTTSSDGGANE